MELNDTSAWMLKELAGSFGVQNAVEAHFEWLYAEEHGELPENARFLQSVEKIIDRDGDEHLLFVWRDPAELRLQ